MKQLLVATRSRHKLQEIRQLLGVSDDLELIDLVDAGIPQSPDEDGIEAFETFHENALAKARYFARKSGLTTLADDSGLCVDALEGAPGVYSKRFSGRSDLTGQELDQANNQKLLDALREVPDGERSAHYFCAIALHPFENGDRVVDGTVEGKILREPVGLGGFGYDPLFFYPPFDASFAQISGERKNAVSHRSSALKAIRPLIQAL